MYSSAINLLLAMIASVLALNFFEPVGAAMDFGSGYGRGIWLIVLFSLIYYILRALVDWRFKADIAFPKWIDRLGAAMLGFLTALIGTGVILVGLQLLLCKAVGRGRAAAAGGERRRGGCDEQDSTHPAGHAESPGLRSQHRRRNGSNGNIG